MNKKIGILFLSFILICSLSIYSASEMHSFRKDFTLDFKVLKGEMIEKNDVKIIFNLSYGIRTRSSFCPTLSISEEPSMDSDSYYDTDIFFKHYVELDSNSASPNTWASTTYNRPESAFDSEEKKKKLVLENIENSYYESEMHHTDGLEFQGKIFEDMLENGEEHKMVKLSDYADYLPVGIESSRLMYNRNMKKEIPEINSYTSRIDDFFKFPVKDDMRLNCKLSYGYSIEDEGFRIDRTIELEEPYNENENIFTLLSAVNEDSSSLYLGFEDGKHYDIPKEYKGIYKLKLSKEKNKSEGIRAFIYSYDTKEIEKIYEIEKDEVIERLLLNKNDVLRILSRVEDRFFLTYLDGKNAKLLKRIELNYKDKAVENIYSGKNCILILYTDNYFECYEDESRKKVLDGKLEKEYLDLKANKKMYEVVENFFDASLDFVFDEDKLYILKNLVYKSQVIIMDKKGIKNVVEYSFPIKKTRESLEKNESKELHFYEIENADFIIQ